ncbi:MAG: 50S ribosomal protein L29 [Bdellovibrionales bacterium]|nr:50S ribosomal protein L29 [Bdellovibrionales bacterium]
MAIKSFKSLKGLSKDELSAKARELREKLFGLKIEKATGQLQNTALVWKTRKELARVLSLSTEKAKATK